MGAPPEIQRLLITGSSGELGARLVAHFRHQGATIMGIDVLAPQDEYPPQEFMYADLTSQDWYNTVRKFEPDTIIHAAFRGTPMRKPKVLHQMNLTGTRNVLTLTEELQPARFMLVSSATAYGAWADNPIPMDETVPLRAGPAFPYAVDRTELDEMVAQFAEDHPQIAVSRIRPTIIGSPGKDYTFSRSIFKKPYLIRLDGVDTPTQFVHIEDVVNAIETILTSGGRGPYNVAPPNWVTPSEIARERRKLILGMPYWLVYSFSTLGWTLHLPTQVTPPTYLNFVRHPWVVYPKRLLEEFDFHFRYSSLDTLRVILGLPLQRTESVEQQ